MAESSNACDKYRLRLSLEDRLSDAEQAALATHLETCAACRQELERLAAASQLWGDARLLRGDGEPGAGLTIGLAPGTLESEGHESDLDADGRAWIDFLDPPDPDQPDTLGRLGAYQVLEVLGQGGMGVVLKALDPALDRTVAIKVLAPNLAHGATARRRFEREARAAAAVAHEHIVSIHFVGEFRGLPYLVMQYIPGRSLQERLDASGPLEVKEILRIGTQAARALAAAHAQGVVHRDIKPANILLENCIERVKLTDFGLARAIDDASLTQSGVIAGTPQYMAPEQARGEPVDARSDLFSLGAVLYAMAGGRPPFRADSAMAVLKRVCDDRHRSIRELNSDIPDWLEAIIDRLLAKDRADRFQAAAEVADLLERGLAHVQQPTVVPCPSVPGFRTPVAANLDLDIPPAKTSRRSRRRLAVAAGLALLALAGMGASEAAGLTQVADFVATILRIKTPEGTLVVKVDDPGVKVDVDNEVMIIGGAGPQEIRLRTGLHRVQATRNGQPVKDELISIMKGKKEIVAIDLEPTTAAMTAPGSRIERPVLMAPSSHVEQCMTCHKRSDALDGPLPPDHPPINALNYSIPRSNPLGPDLPTPVDPSRARALVWSIAYSPDGRRLAIGQQGIDGHPSVFRVRDVAARKDVFCMVRPSAYRCVAFSPDGKKVAAGTFDSTVELFRLDGNVAMLDGFWKDLGEPINALGFQRTERGDLVAGNWAGKLLFFHSWRVESVQFDCGKIFTMAFSPDGSTMAVAGASGVIQLYEIESGLKLATLMGHDGPVESLDFSPDGKHLASASWDKTVRVWEVASGREEVRLGHSAHERLAVRFSPDGKTLACADGEHEMRHFQPIPDVSVQLWDWKARTLLHSLSGHTNCVYTLAFSPDGKTLASGSMDQTVKLWDTATGQLRETIVPGESGTPVRLWDMAAGQLRERIVPGESGNATPPGMVSTSTNPAQPLAVKSGVVPPIPTPPLAHPEAIFPLGGKEAWAAAYSPDGKTLITSGSDGFLLRWVLHPSPSGSLEQFEVERLPRNGTKPGSSYEASAIAFAPDGKLFATADWDHTISLWDAEGNHVAILKRHAEGVRSVAFSPDGKLLASGSWDKTVKIWNVASRQVVRSLPPQHLPVSAVAFSPDGKRLAVGTGDWRNESRGEVELWDPATGRQIGTAWHSPRDIKALAFAPDGKRLAIAHPADRLANGSEQGVVAIVGVDDARLSAVTLLNCPTGATSVAFSPDGKILAAGEWNGTVDLWDADKQHPLTSSGIPAHGAMIFDVVFAPDGKHIATASKDGTVKIWSLDSLKLATESRNLQ